MRRALGKGLSQLIADQYDGAPSEIPVDSIVPNALQPRVHFESGALDDLSRSIKEHGILQPVAVRPIADGQYELIAGERRLRAAKLAGLRTIPVIIRAATNENSLELALIENIQREDINALECAHAYRRLVDDFGLTQEQVAEKVGKSRVAITNTLRLLRLPKKIQEAVSSGQISEAHARALLGFENEAHQLAVFDQIVNQNLTVKAVEQKSRETSTRSKSPSKKQTASLQTDPNLGALEEALSTYFGTPVKIDKSQSEGTLGIKFYSDDDLERILEILGFRP